MASPAQSMSEKQHSATPGSSESTMPHGPGHTGRPSTRAASLVQQSRQGRAPSEPQSLPGHIGNPGNPQQSLRAGLQKPSMQNPPSEQPTLPLQGRTSHLTDGSTPVAQQGTLLPSGTITHGSGGSTQQLGEAHVPIRTGTVKRLHVSEQHSDWLKHSPPKATQSVGPPSATHFPSTHTRPLGQSAVSLHLTIPPPSLHSNSQMHSVGHLP
mmetsp:Transcript_48313/g.120944  ORF Transcript_48313/g.120944 Transcript_48313/m.120944 type:complete len:211 (+) Transcript_48313:351-983(+)